MKKNVFIKEVSGTDSVKLDSTTRLMRSGKDIMDENAATVTQAKSRGNMQPRDDFRYSGRCFCGSY